MERMLAAAEIDVPAEPAAEGARRATGVAGPVGTSRTTAPDPEVPATVQRRTFPRGLSAPDSQGRRRLQEARGAGRAAAPRGALQLAFDRTGGASASRASWSPGADASAAPRPSSSTRASGNSKSRTVDCSASWRGRRRSSRSKKTIRRGVIAALPAGPETLSAATSRYPGGSGRLLFGDAVANP